MTYFLGMEWGSSLFTMKMLLFSGHDLTFYNCYVMTKSRWIVLDGWELFFQVYEYFFIDSSLFQSNIILRTPLNALVDIYQPCYGKIICLVASICLFVCPLVFSCLNLLTSDTCRKSYSISLGVPLKWLHVSSHFSLNSKCFSHRRMDLMRYGLTW